MNWDGYLNKCRSKHQPSLINLMLLSLPLPIYPFGRPTSNETFKVAMAMAKHRIFRINKIDASHLSLSLSLSLIFNFFFIKSLICVNGIHTHYNFFAKRKKKVAYEERPFSTLTKQRVLCVDIIFV